MKNERLMKASEVAEILGYDRTYTYHLASKGYLESVKIGRSRRFTEQHVEDYIERLLSGNSGKRGLKDE